MGKFLTVLGAIVGVLFLCVLVVGGGIAAYLRSVGPELDSDSQAYVDQTIPVLVEGWDPEALRSRSSDELRPYLKEPDMGNLYGMFRRLGAMKHYDGSRGQANLFFQPRGIRTTAAYVAKADFENGPATIKMSLIKRDGAWQILEFRVDSPYFLQR